MTAFDIAVKLIEFVVDIVGHELAQEILSAEAIKRVNEVVDKLEDAKFPRNP